MLEFKKVSVGQPLLFVDAVSSQRFGPLSANMLWKKIVRAAWEASGCSSPRRRLGASQSLYRSFPNVIRSVNGPRGPG